MRIHPPVRFRFGQAAALVLQTACTTAGPQAPPADGPCQSQDISFDECEGSLGPAVAERILVSTHGYFGGLSGDSPRTLTTQAELEAFWSDSGLASAGVTLPTVDFESEQAMAFRNSSGDSCGDDARVVGVYADASGAAGLVARIEVRDVCSVEYCADTAAYPLIQVWAIPRGELLSCREGHRCQACP